MTTRHTAVANKHWHTLPMAIKAYLVLGASFSHADATAAAELGIRGDIATLVDIGWVKSDGPNRYRFAKVVIDAAHKPLGT